MGKAFSVCFKPKHNSISEMLVNMNMRSFGEILNLFISQAFQSRVITSYNILLSSIFNSTAS